MSSGHLARTRPARLETCSTRPARRLSYRFNGSSFVGLLFRRASSFARLFRALGDPGLIRNAASTSFIAPVIRLICAGAAPRLFAVPKTPEWQRIADKIDVQVIFASPYFVNRILPREWNYLSWEFSLGLAAFDKVDDCPIKVELDSLAGPISQSAEGNHYFLVEPACG